MNPTTKTEMETLTVSRDDAPGVMTRRLHEIHQILGDHPPTTPQSLAELMATLAGELLALRERVDSLQTSIAHRPFSAIATNGTVTIGFFEGTPCLWPGNLSDPPMSRSVSELRAASGLEFRSKRGVRYRVAPVGHRLTWVEATP